MRQFTLTVELDEIIDEGTPNEDTVDLAYTLVDFKLPEGAKINAKLFCGMVAAYARDLLERNDSLDATGKDGKVGTNRLIKDGQFDATEATTMSTGDKGMQ